MSQLILALHGNPGDSTDFDPVFEKLGIDSKADAVVHHRPVAGADIRQLIIGIERDLSAFPTRAITVIAYSWGCYLACHWFAQSKLNIARMIFISPVLVAENPVSKFALIITRLPMLGNIILNKIAKNKSPEFIEKCFQPNKPSPQDYATLYKQLNNPVLWKGAIHYKYQQQTIGINDLKKINDVEIVIIRGTQDASVNWTVQQNALRALITNWDHVGVHEIKNTGHALLWTEPDQLAHIIRRAMATGTRSPGTAPQDKKDSYNVVSFLRKHAQALPQKIALRWAYPEEVRSFNGDVSTRFGTKEINFHDFYQRIGRLAKGLTELGLCPGDRVILFLPMSLEMYVSMFAIQYIGAIAVFLDSWARSSQLGASARCVAPKAMISHRQAFDLIAGISELDNIPMRIIAGPGHDDGYCARLEELLETNGSVALAAVKPDDTALITFTTGSSGDPKGANRTHQFLCAQHAALKDVVPYKNHDTDIPAFPIFSLNNLASGVTTVLPAIDLARPHQHDAIALASQITHEKITCTTLSPSMFNALSDFCMRARIKLTTLQRVITGGAPISRDDVYNFRGIAPAAKIWILYGSTEVEPMAHIEAQEMLALENDPDPEIVEHGVNVGHIAHGLKYKFIKPCKNNIDFANLDWREWRVAKNKVGEFIVAGDHVCANYYNNDAAFHRTKIREKDGTVWHRTGDLARLDERDYLWIVGRVHNMISRLDQQLYPVPAEIILNRCAFVKKGAFLGMPDTRLGERTAVAVEFCAGLRDQAGSIKEILRLFHKNKIIVDSLYVVDTIPMDPRHHSKVEYALLRRKIQAENIDDLLAQKKYFMQSRDHAIVHPTF